MYKAKFKAFRSILLFSLIGASVFAATGCQTTPVVNTNDAPRGDEDNPSTMEQPAQTADANDAFASERTAVLWVKGLACPFCVQNVDKQLAAVSGVELVHVDLPTGKVQVLLAADNPASQDELAAAIVSSGFTLDRAEMP